MANVVYMRRDNDFLTAPIVNATQIEDKLYISYANPDFYFRGTFNFYLAEGNNSWTERLKPCSRTAKLEK